MAYTSVEPGEEGSEEIHIYNIEHSTYEPVVLSTDPSQNLKEAAHFANYFLCGYKAILSHHEDLVSQVAKPKGLKIMIDSRVPPAAGLSSSSAFVVCAALTTMHANGMADKIS